MKIIFKKTFITLLGCLILLNMSGITTSAANTVPTKTTTIDRVFEYLGLKYENAIQNFDYGDKNEVFITQRVKSATVLSRCIIKGEKCEVEDYVILGDYGHGESLEVIKENGKTLLWVGNTVNSGDSNKWSTDISLIEYKVNPAKPTGAEVVNVKTITNLEEVTSKISGSAYRSAVAIADGKDRICFRIQIGTSASNTYYAVYKLSDVTKALKASSDNKMFIKDLSSLQLTNFTGLTRPNNSFQGFDITGTGSGKKFLYLYGGAAGDTPTLYKYSYTNGGNAEHINTIKITGSYVGTLEAEGIKVENNPNNSSVETVFLSLNPGLDSSGNQKPIRLYTLFE
ncbi:helveticin J family class III bacteriocin [Peribacillus butanolivorans]|uniref:helveticin J family class III bacteriocin n=1 Tax=Peribacillus butanolivorans TaxID=421767 RepID=UPI00167F95FA|nr:helveticin J family class III bacteriocin [Peribacillus butanolivorans]QNU04904.1 hypothetical protein GM240_13855 [Peribacillus butanolivorans]